MINSSKKYLAFVSFFLKKNKLSRQGIYKNKSLFSLFFLAACGSKKENTSTEVEVSDQIDANSTQNTFTLTSGNNYAAESDSIDLLTSNYTVIETITSIKDTNTTDSDVIDISTDKDVAQLPIISGFETINFIIEEQFSSGDDTFNIELGSISQFDKLTFSNSAEASPIAKVSLTNAKGEISFGDEFNQIILHSVSDEDITISTNSDIAITLFNNAKALFINGGGKSLDISTASTGDINISDNSSVDLSAVNAEENITIVSNGNVVVKDASSLKGNMTISAIGTIDVQNINASSGKLYLENLRALPGSDIRVEEASMAKSVEISSTGSVFANSDGGLKSAEAISVTAAENSQIDAVSTIIKSVILNAKNVSNAEVIFDLDIDSMSSLALKGTAPLLVNISGDDLNGATVTNSNSEKSSIKISGANTDISEVSSNIEVRLDNFDGKTIILGQNQNVAVDAEIPQTSTISTPEYRFSTDATSSTSNSISINMIDTNLNNSDTISTIAGLVVTDVQNLNIDLSDSVDLETSQNISGIDLKQVTISGSGDFTLTNSSIVGVPDGTVALNASNLSGKLTISLDNTENSVKTIVAGSGNDDIEIDTFSTSSAGISITAGAGHDVISLTADSDANDAKISIIGGDEIDIIKFATGLDFSLSDVSISTVEKLEFTGGVNPVKLPSETISTGSYEISENGTGSLTLEIFPTAQVINLSSLTFDNSIASGTDKIVVNGANFLQALTITGSSIDDEISGTHTSNDVISSGDGNDTINGSDGNDTLTPGNGIDHITPGLGNDTVNLTEVVAAVDTLYYSYDAGASNVDTVSQFDVRISNDIISLDVSELTNPITYGNGNASSAASLGSINFLDQNLNTNLDFSSNAAATIIKLAPIDKSDFASALGTSVLTVANDATVNFLWYDVDTSDAVFGYANENVSSPDDNNIKADDTFVEIVRLSMSTSTYTHFLDADNFVFI